MAFTSNPLSLSVPDPFFESWLRENGYPEIVDQRTSAAAAATATSGTTATATSSITDGFFISIFSHIFTLLSLFTINPFSKLTNDDLTAQTPSWTTSFIGSSESYSFPLSVSQARLRVHENVKRYARNYATLFVLFFACSLLLVALRIVWKSSNWMTNKRKAMGAFSSKFSDLSLSLWFIIVGYQMPLALVGLISCLALWDVFKFCSERWGLDQYPTIRQCLIRVAQCVAIAILICSNVQRALFWALGVSYAGMILHAGFRKLDRAKQTSRGRSK